MINIIAKLINPTNKQLFLKVLLFNNNSNEFLRLDNIEFSHINSIFNFSNIDIDYKTCIDFYEEDSFEAFSLKTQNNLKRTVISHEEFIKLFNWMKTNTHKENINGMSYTFNDKISLLDWGFNSKIQKPLTMIFNYDDGNRNIRLDLNEDNSFGFNPKNKYVLELFEHYFNLMNDSLSSS